MAKITILLLISLLNFTKSKLTGKIVGGEFSRIVDFPHSVFVVINCDYRVSTCGASILNQAILLTAAHCLIKCTDKFYITAYVGSERKHQGIERNVVSFKVHDKYDPQTKAQDIALMRLGKNLQFGKRVKRIIIMKSPPKYFTAEIAGWGWIDSVGTKSEVLKHAKQRVYSRSQCFEIVRFIPVGTICASDIKGYPEKGDSGSALIIQGSIQIGIVSFKKRQIANETIVYTDVSYYHDWILRNARELYCQNKKTGIKLMKKYKNETEKKWEKKKLLIEKLGRKLEENLNFNCM
ncbi:trypsin alpha-4-like [Leguminivora glycinivorella]|uniref:trypsin alpha-4-like n=1 Tax=Leguminivora glycinivorella TaxID=1035111 RepID=UPI00200D3477|nr:trypsin alpha-4-like [Leguminivora glycinivorella]